MCAGIEFGGRRILWSDENPQLPMLRKDGSICWGPWGKAFTEARRDIPAGGWARLESIRDGKWKRYHPVSVKIPATAFMEKNAKGEAVWFPLASGIMIQGAAIETKNQIMTAEWGDKDVRVYVVTMPADDTVRPVHDRMPRLIVQP